MSFWKRLLRIEESPKVEIARRESTQSSEVPNAQPPFNRPTPATPLQLTTSKALEAPDQRVFFPEASREDDAQKHHPSSPNLSLETELLAAATKPVPDTWRTLKGRDADCPFSLRFPRTWLEGVSPEEGLAHNVIHPPSAQRVWCGGKPMITPCVTIVATRVTKLHDDALLDEWVATRGQQFQGYLLRESVKTKLHGIHALAMSHDFILGGETWTCLMVLLVAGNKIWYADASGLSRDVLSNRAELMSILSSLEAGQAEPVPAANSVHADRVKTQAATGANLNTRDAAREWAKPAPPAPAVSAETTGTRAAPTGASNVHDAAKDGDLETVRALVHGNPDLVFSKDRWGRTALHWAAERGHKDVAEVLLAHGADVNAKDKDGRTPLHDASFCGPMIAGEELAGIRRKKEVAEALLGHGANVNANDNTGSTPLHRVTTRELAQVLLAHGADANATDIGGRTPLHSVRGNNKEVAELLVADGAEVNARDKGGSTPLHSAADWNYSRVAEVLLAHGAEVNATNPSGQTPLHCAVRVSAGKGQMSFMLTTARLLLAHGAEVNARDKDGLTPFHYAGEWAESGAAELLRQHGGRE